MFIIHVDGLPIRLPDSQSTFNPRYGFACKGSNVIGLKVFQTGHLLLPHDSEGNITVSPGESYVVVNLVEKRKIGGPDETTISRQQCELNSSKTGVAGMATINSNIIKSNGTTSERNNEPIKDNAPLQNQEIFFSKAELKQQSKVVPKSNLVQSESEQLGSKDESPAENPHTTSLKFKRAKRSRGTTPVKSTTGLSPQMSLKRHPLYHSSSDSD